MTPNHTKNNFYIGIALALTAVIVWSGNYVVARGIAQTVPPISVAFYRWFIASVCVIPIAWNKLKTDKAVVLQHKSYLFFAAVTGVTLFNTFIYLAGHHTKAINLALIGTTTAPIFATILASVFLKEIISTFRIAGMMVCFTGILFLLSQGSWQKLVNFHFEKGDVLMFISAISFASYTTLVRKKPATISALTFLMLTFVIGTVVLFPFYLYEHLTSPAVVWNMNLGYTFAYLAIGNSVLAFLCWNAAIKRLGASVTALFTNLIPVFSTIEAVVFLNEKFTNVHLVSGALIVTGLIIANLKK